MCVCLCLCVCVCVYARARVCVRACVCASVRVSAFVCLFGGLVGFFAVFVEHLISPLREIQAVLLGYGDSSLSYNTTQSYQSIMSRPFTHYDIMGNNLIIQPKQPGKLALCLFDSQQPRHLLRAWPEAQGCNMPVSPI